jgi:DUF1009 family protein
VGRTLGLISGAGMLPARMAAEASRQGWRVVAFTFGDAPGVEVHAGRVIPGRLAEIGPVLAAMSQEGIEAAVFSGKFWLGDVLKADAADAAGAAIATQAGSLSETNLTTAVVSTLAALGIEVLDQRQFVGDWLGARGCLGAHRPDPRQWADVRVGLGIARTCAGARIGQTVVIKRGVVAAVEALEGTTAAIRRGGALAGGGAVAVKAVAADNDYRFDTPAIGADTIEAAAASGVVVVAAEAGRVMLFQRAAVIAAADRHGIALVSVDDAHLPAFDGDAR